MKPTQDNYPVFEPNQVLLNTHLNVIVNYPNEQERLTRANLIGIGIVCGLEARLEVKATATSIHLSKGCGVTSEGYLVVESEDIEFESYREYKMPSELNYPPFTNRSARETPQYPIWELFPSGEPGTTPLGAPPDFLNDKAVVLFLELKKQGLRNCSPNNCDDKGAAITATVRRLLLRVRDLTKIIDESKKAGRAHTFADLHAVLLDRLGLIDLRLPRYDVPNSGPATTNQVLAAFLAIFQRAGLATATGKALTAAYKAFKPILEGTYPSNPFSGFIGGFGFLDHAPKTPEQVRFLQYYCGFFEDLQKGYDEFRWKAAELMCGCCPREDLFPRHLMLGKLIPAPETNPDIYRHHFMPSAAVGRCEERVKEVQQLFRRLVEMTERFTNNPLPPPAPGTRADEQIRITPSKLGDVPLSEKAIPYYYLQHGTPPLYQVWSPEKTRRNRATENLGYRSDEYKPEAAEFITAALSYDLEPSNFLRIEGHLGKEYQSALATLLDAKRRYRLPIEILALRTGAFAETAAVSLTADAVRFPDLEAVYDALREELLSNLFEGVRFLYGVPLPGSALPEGIPALRLLKERGPNFKHAKATVGAWYEKHLSMLASIPYIDVDQNNIDTDAIITVYCALFRGTTDLPPQFFPHVVSIYYFTKLAEILPASLDELGFPGFENKYQDLIGLVRYFRDDVSGKLSAEFKKFIPQEELLDHLDEVLYSGKLEAFRSVHEEYLRRVREVKQNQFLSFFLKKHPGIQHKAGVPLGGTFIIVYHDKREAPPPELKRDLDIIRAEAVPITRTVGSTALDTLAVTEAFARISSKQELALDPDIRFLLGKFTGEVPDLVAQPPASSDEAEKIIEKTVSQIADGTVIADFFLPYLCCGQGAPIQFVLPAPTLGLAVEIGCTSPERVAEATITPNGGTSPFTYQLDKGGFKELKGKVVLSPGDHTILIRDSAGVQSDVQSVIVPEPLTIGEPSFEDERETYKVKFTISGGTPPYKAEPGTVKGNAYTSKSTEGGRPVTVTVRDSVGCEVRARFIHRIVNP